MNPISKENSSDQINNGKNDQKPDQSNTEECVSNQNAKEINTQLQFRPMNMFNSPPPGFIRPPPGPPPLLNPNFFPPPNRFWGNTPPGMNANMNQNKTFQSSNRWNTPSNFERQRFNRPPPDFGVESRSNRRINNDEDGDVNFRDDDVNLKLDDNADEDSENFDDPSMNDTNDAESDQTEPTNSNQCDSVPKRQNPFSQVPRIPPNEEGDFILNHPPNKPNNIGRLLHDDMDQQPRFNMFRQNSNDGPSNSQQSPAFHRNNNLHTNHAFNSQNFNNQVGPGPQPLFSPQNMNFNSPMRGRGGIRGDASPYFRPRGRGGPGMNMNRGNFRPNFRGNNRGKW